MARERDPLPIGAPILPFLLLIICLSAVGSVEVPLASPTPRPPLIIPLHFNHANSSRAQAGSRRLNNFDSRRYLQEEHASLPNAHMRLYDNLLTNGYYTTKIGIGTPPQQFALIVDSGSTVTYVPCSTCEQCGNHQDPRFQPDKSSSYQPVKCNPDCSCDSEHNQCVYERQYAEMSSSSGVLGNDLITFGPESDLKPQRAVFGCENSETGDLYSQHADGIMGLGRGQLSIVDQLVEKGVIDDAFSLCYGGMDIGGGAMVLGRIDPPTGMAWSRSDPVRSPYYNIELKEIQVAGKALKLDPKVFDSRHGTVLDSGTTYAYLPEHAFVAFRDAVIDQLHSLKQVPGPDPNYKDICYAGASRYVNELSDSFPDVEMVFGNGQKILLSPENYLFKHSKVEGAYCLGVFQNGKDPTTLLGGIIVRNTLVTYDRQNEKIGFWKTNCSELWERLRVDGAPATAPSPPPSTTNSTTVVAPALPPLPGEIEIGMITFDMSINVTYKTLKPHLPEVAKYIAKELDIDVHQVEMVNATSKGNYTLIRWAIWPAGSNKFMSNATAMEIINRLTEHRVQLPESLGSYQLLEWNVAPPSNRSWWHQHLVGVFVGILVVVVLSLSALLAWSIWRKRANGPGIYRPVSAPVPEQELQPI
ncbi:Eukaryotic aspartyl protease family protein [Rhynchospora pubera]|uniref:Eukaryotic aspartyl protease family protein n=1 Tax=Rhynchospora pubera TaxID=906938 RepID=A0AAV8HJ59_9POAL|nr:Eukaryotic aspartyl protease family protein [Rhynchospora pubera]